MKPLFDYLPKLNKPLDLKNPGGINQWRVAKLTKKLWPFLWRAPSISAFRSRGG
jgi:hypothetical protein